MPFQKYAAEMLATFSLAFAVSASLVNDLGMITPLIAALTLGLFVYTIGGVSGAHVNPAITVALASKDKISLPDALLYIASQLVGAIIALQLCLYLFGAEPGADMAGGTAVGIAEALGAFFLAFGVAFAVDRGNDLNSGLVVGGSLLLGILVAAGASNGVLNPAVSIAVGGLSGLSLTYFLAPVVGALAGVWSYGYLVSGSK
jgi:glycerol uptake facilitator-like aquaporin